MTGAGVAPTTLMTRLVTGDVYTGVASIVPYAVALLVLLGVFLRTSDRLLSSRD